MGILCRSRDELDLAPVIPDESIDTIDSLLYNNSNRFLTLSLESSFDGSRQGEGFPSHLEKKKQFMAAQKSNGDPATLSPIGLTDDLAQCHQELLADTFLVLWKSLEFIRTESTMLVYRDTERQDVRFDVRDGAVIQDFITWSDVWFFIVAIVVNIIFSGILAFIGTVKLQSFCTEFLMDDYNTKGMMCTASHRLDYEVSSESFR